MKKVMAVILLVLIMLAPAITGILTQAADGPEKINVVFFNCDSTEGFGFNRAPTVDTANKTEGKASLKLEFGDTIFQRGFEEGIDATGCDTLEFDVYVANMDDLNAMDYVDGQIEITSSKTVDSQELAWNPLEVLKAQVKEEGWTHIILPFSEAGKTGGDIDLSHVNWFRWYWVGSQNRLTLNYDNFVFTNHEQYSKVEEALKSEQEGNGTLFNGCNSDAGITGVTVCEDEKYVKTGTGSWKFSLGAQMVVSSGLPTTDMSSFNRIEFDLYVSDAEAVKALKGDAEFEITSSGKSDEKEYHWYPTNFLQNVQDGWNHITLKFADAGETQGAPDLSAINYVRWYWVGNDAGVDAYIDNIRLLTAEEETLLTEEYEFVVFQRSEQPYIVSATAGKNTEKRFADQNLEVVYKFEIEHPVGARQITFTAKVGAQLLLQVGTDGENYEEVYRWTTDEITEDTDGATFNKGMSATVMTFDLTEFVELSKTVNTVYVRIADSYPQINGAGNGWGGNIYTGVPAALVVTYADGLDTPDEPEPPVETETEGSEISESETQEPGNTETDGDKDSESVPPAGETDKPQDEEKKGGCGSVLGISALCLSLVSVAGTAVLICKKKND